MIRRFFCLLFLVACLSQETSLEGCTGIRLSAKDGSIVHGRTLEFGIIIDSSIVVVPRGYKFKGTTPQGEGLTYQAKYGAVGAIAFNNLAIMDGLNEKGLAVGTFYFPTFAGYSEITAENQSKALSPLEFSNWILTQFATIEEVKQALGKVVIAPTISKEWGPNPPPFHYIVYEKNGNCLVIEPLNGKLITYENKLGTFTNSPTFDWHMTNLRNYINLTPFNAKPVKLDGVEFAPFGEGSGMVGLPGDFTPPSRFVQAAIFSATAIPPKDNKEGIFTLFHILNQFDIPVGVAKTKEGDVIYTDQTQITCARDPQTLKFYFRTYLDQNIKVIDLNRFNLDAKSVKSLNVTGTMAAEDISDKLN